MKPSHALSLLYLCSGVLLAATTGARAQSLLSVDFDVNAGKSPAGFTQWELDTTATASSLYTTNYGAIHLALDASKVASAGNPPPVDGSGNLTAWNNTVTGKSRGAIGNSGAFTYGSLYRDFFTASGGGELGFQISGLTASTSYSITFYSFDENNSRTNTFVNYTGGGIGVLGTIAYDNPANGDGNPTSNGQYALTATVTTDALGRLTFGEIDGVSGFGPVLNGFTLSASGLPVPEPGSITMASVGLFSLFAFNRLRRRK